MKALVMREYMKFEYMDVEKPNIEPDEVLVKVMAVSVCGSDIHGMDGSTDRRRVPIIMGHEASGIIDSIGSAVRNYSEGDRVTFDSTIYCGNCEYCLTGRINLCDRRHVLGVSCSEYRQHGAFCEYVAIPERILYKLKDNISYQDAALTEPMSVALHAVNQLDFNSNHAVVLWGTGTIALFAVQFFKLRKCGTLAVVGRSDKKLALARELGADVVINSINEKVETSIEQMTDGKGVDIAYDAAGAQETFTAAVASLKKGGTLVSLANLKNNFILDIGSVITKQLTIKGSCASSGEYDDILRLLSQGKIRTDYVISKELPLSMAADFMTALYEKQIPDFGKLILRP